MKVTVKYVVRKKNSRNAVSFKTLKEARLFAKTDIWFRNSETYIEQVTTKVVA